MTIFSRELWTELLYTLKRNKRRSIITSLGVFAGMFFFTVLTSLSTGLRNSAFSSLDGVNNSAIYFIPGRTTKPYQGFKANRQINTTYRDYINIQQQSHLIEKRECDHPLGCRWCMGQYHGACQYQEPQCGCMGCRP